MNDPARRAIEAECARLINLYANLYDASDWAAVAALYAEDGLMTRPTAPDVAITGCAAVLAAFAARPPRVSRHICANIVIEVEDESHARSESAMLLFSGVGAPLVGFFHDWFVLTVEGWRLTEQRGSIVFSD
jgi:hypothetical protein